MNKHNLSLNLRVNIQPEIHAAFDKVPVGTVEFHALELGHRYGEPLLLGFNALLEYAKSYRAHFDRPLAEDYILGPAWLSALVGFRNLLNGDGAVAMYRDISTDSKSNGVLEEAFWLCMAAAGFKEEDI